MTIFIPTPLRQFAGGKDTVEVGATTVAGALEELTQAHPDLRRHLFTGEGKVRAFVNVYLNDEDVRYLPEKDATAVTAKDTLSIIPSIAGGADRFAREVAVCGFPPCRQEKVDRMGHGMGVQGWESRSPRLGAKNKKAPNLGHPQLGTGSCS